jgi:hypothetical protein
MHEHELQQSPEHWHNEADGCPDQSMYVDWQGDLGLIRLTIIRRPKRRVARRLNSRSFVHSLCHGWTRKVYRTPRPAAYWQAVRYARRPQLAVIGYFGRRVMTSLLSQCGTVDPRL